VSAAGVAADLNKESRRAAWAGIDLAAFDRAARLSPAERRALEALGPQGLRRNRSRGVPRRTASSWRALERLVTPLDAARAALHHGDDVCHRRAGLHAVGVVLEHCLVLGRSYSAWTADEWAELMGSSAEKFLADRALPTETTVRPFAIALAYLIAGFDRFEQLGTFNRLHLGGVSHFSAGSESASAR